MSIDKSIFCILHKGSERYTVFYDKFAEACGKNDITPAQVRKDLGISQSTMASWKSRGLTPKYGTVKRIADYLQIEWTDLVPEEEQGQTVIDHMKGKISSIGNQRFNTEIIATAIGGATRVQHPELYEYEIELNRIDAALALLNTSGRQEAVKRVEELTEIPKYQREKPQDMSTTKATPPESPTEEPQEGK